MPRSKIRETQVADIEFLSPEEHEGLHDRDIYIEISRSNNKVSSIDEWVDDTKAKKISSTAIIRTNNKVTSTVKQIYDYDTGTIIIATVTGTIHRQSGKIYSMTYNRDIDMEGV